ncbi:hypothetical protein MAR_005204 [Mya arenaria]|uniref:Uncharacterized protein n=1 Tax=Mya arenaria TaxID=6604 RepID=A0ABY7F1P3_MYAAR|nr:hypothetical protein MAR_005204 [Mya arenaria]
MERQKRGKEADKNIKGLAMVDNEYKETPCVLVEGAVPLLVENVIQLVKDVEFLPGAVGRKLNQDGTRRGIMDNPTGSVRSINLFNSDIGPNIPTKCHNYLVCTFANFLAKARYAKIVSSAILFTSISFAFQILKNGSSVWLRISWLSFTSGCQEDAKAVTSKSDKHDVCNNS